MINITCTLTIQDVESPHDKVVITGSFESCYKVYHKFLYSKRADVKEDETKQYRFTCFDHFGHRFIDISLGIDAFDNEFDQTVQSITKTIR